MTVPAPARDVSGIRIWSAVFSLAVACTFLIFAWKVTAFGAISLSLAASALAAAFLTLRGHPMGGGAIMIVLAGLMFLAALLSFAPQPVLVSAVAGLAGALSLSSAPPRQRVLSPRPRGPIACPHCTARLRAGSRFCSTCGRVVPPEARFA